MENLPKILITAEADQALERMLTKVNDGFPSGRVKKTQLASWIIKDFEARSFLKIVEKIREDHFDEITHLKSVIKKMEEAKRSSRGVELDRLLSPLRGRTNKTTRKNAEDENKITD